MIGTFNAGATGNISGKQLPKIATSASNALNSQFLNSSQALQNNDNLTYKVRNDGTVAIINGETIIGFTTVDAISGDASSTIAHMTEAEARQQAVEKAEALRLERLKAEEEQKKIAEAQAKIEAENNTAVASVSKMETDTNVDETVEEFVEEPEMIEQEVPPITVETIDDDNIPTGEVGGDITITEANFPRVYHYVGTNPDRLAALDYVYQYLKGKGFNDYQIAGIMGAMCAESGFDINAQNPNSSAHGLCQWLSDRQPSSWDIDSQLDHMMEEYVSRKDSKGLSVKDHYDNVNDPESAAKTWCLFFEGYKIPGSSDDHMQCTYEMYEYITQKYGS